MNEIPFSEKDDCAELLAVPPFPANAEKLRQTVLLQTTRLLRRRRRFKQLALVAALAACYVAGLATLRLALPPPVDDRGNQEVIVQGTDVDPQPPAVVEGATEPPADAPARVWEHWGELASPDKRAHVYRMAGDRYLDEAGDLAAALRCYTRSVEETPPEAVSISPDDNWLLMALKEARQKETRHGPNDG